MASYFLDSSSLVKRFAAEKGTGFLMGLFRKRPTLYIFVSRITLVEVSSALARKGHSNEITNEAEIRSQKRLRRSFGGDRLGVAELSSTLIEEAATLARKHRLRGYDAVQLASALDVSRGLFPSVLAPLIFVSADEDLNRAAIAEGLSIENPNNHS